MCMHDNGWRCVTQCMPPTVPAPPSANSVSLLHLRGRWSGHHRRLPLACRPSCISCSGACLNPKPRLTAAPQGTLVRASQATATDVLIELAYLKSYEHMGRAQV